MSTYARVIEDSVNPEGDRLTTIEVEFWRPVLAEFNTHRVFSRNSASSRAIPVNKQIDRLTIDPAEPLVWSTEQAGMQGGEPLTGKELEDAQNCWERARHDAIAHARHLQSLGVHKSIVNRLLEPFMWHRVIVTATDWQGFWDQRCSPLAEPRIEEAANAMRDALEDSTPTLVGYGEWHMPYLRPEDWQGEVTDWPEHCVKMRKVSAARCARVSYLTQDGVRDIEKDLELYERLTSAYPPHSSPLEHVATPSHPGWNSDEAAFHQGNFQGWDQLRHQVLEV